MRFLALFLLMSAVSLSYGGPPEAPKGIPWPGGKWPHDGKEYEKGSFIWIKQADWDKYQKDLEKWNKENTNAAMNAVNEARARRGLPAFREDPELSKGAQAAAEFRAANRIEGHTRNDFAYLPPGASARAAGCAAWPVEMGWGSCCAYENWSYAGAGWAMGADGRRYMHLFVR